MCSTAAQRIAEIGQAIDDLALQAKPTTQPKPAIQAEPAGEAERADQAGPAAQPIVARLAELWGQLAELDPEVARRLAGYQNLSRYQNLADPTDLWPTHRPAHSRRAGHLTDGWDWPSGRRWRAVLAATLRGDGPTTLAQPARLALSCRRSRPQAWRSLRDAAGPTPGAPLWS
jgi:hypothetical protein